jgi:hypothetical protein
MVCSVPIMSPQETKAQKMAHPPAHYHQITLTSGDAPLCSATNCNESLWEQQWSAVFQNYNAAAGYGSGVIASGVKNYAPNEPQ